MKKPAYDFLIDLGNTNSESIMKMQWEAFDIFCNKLNEKYKKIKNGRKETM